MALNPGRSHLTRAAAHSLMYAGESVGAKVASRVTPEHLAKRPAAIAANLTVLLGSRAPVKQVIASAASLSVSSKRRVLLLLLIRRLTDRDQDAAQAVANMLPVEHAGVSWALTGSDKYFSSDILDDLGEPIVCDQVVSLLVPGLEECG